MIVESIRNQSRSSREEFILVTQRTDGMVWVPALEHRLFPRATGGAALEGSPQRGGGGVLAGPAQLCCSASRSQPICTRPAAAILNCGVRRQASVLAGAEAPPADSAFSRTRSSGPKGQVRGFCSRQAPCKQVKLDQTQRKREKKVRLYFIMQILFPFPGIDNGLCWQQNNQTWREGGGNLWFTALCSTKLQILP